MNSTDRRTLLPVRPIEFDIGNDNGWGNAQLEYDTPYTSNVTLTGDGYLNIIAREESYGGLTTSGRIHTRDKVTLGYGRYEARLKMPFGLGYGRPLVAGQQSFRGRLAGMR